MEAILFYMFAGLSIVAGLLFLTRTSSFMGAIWLMVILLSAAALFGILGAPILAALQVLISAGAVVVLILFVVMLTRAAELKFRKRMIDFGKVAGLLCTIYLGIVIVIAVLRPPYEAAPDSGNFYESTKTFASLLFGRYAIAFELTGVLLLVACVAVVALTLRKKVDCQCPANPCDKCAKPEDL